MVKKVVLVAGVLVCGLATLFIGLLYSAYNAGASDQERFFAAVSSGEPQQVTALFHPALREQVDEPVLGAWMARLKSELGPFKGTSAANFSTSTRFDSGVKISESKGTVRFEHGMAESELIVRDGQIVKFLVESDKIPADWFQGPQSSELYRQRGEKFLRHFLAGESDAAFASMHEALQKALPPEQLKAMIERTSEQAGALESITWLSEEFAAEKVPTLRIFYTIECEKARTTAEVQFQFENLRGSILAFDLNAKIE